MLQAIYDELMKGRRSVGAEQVVSCAPMYLVASDAQSDVLNDAGETLLDSLEKAAVFDPLQDSFVLLRARMKPSEIFGEVPRLSLTDRFGRSFRTLEEWIRFLSTEMQITTGILLLKIDHVEEIRSDWLWWDSLLRCMYLHKNSFLFLLASKKNQIDELSKGMIARFHTRRIDAATFSLSAFADAFAQSLSEYRLTMSEEGREKVEAAVDACGEDVNMMQVHRWARDTAWRYLMEQTDDTAVPTELPAAWIDASVLETQIKQAARTKSNKKIGYE